MFPYVGTPELNALVFVQIHVKDINDLAPVFSSPNGYRKSVPEDEAPGVTVFQVRTRSPFFHWYSQKS